jgi:hypothetical protein
MSEPVPPSNSEEPPGLPPVLPPSGAHIVRLFVVPALIVAGVVGVLFLFMGVSGWLFGFGRSPEACLADMKSDNPDVRWRAANDLAQVLKRDNRLTTDPKLDLDLADLLNGALTDLAKEEQSFAEKQKQHAGNGSEKKEPLPVPSTLQSQRKYVQFLSACLGTFSVPVGAPLLTRMAQNEKGDAKSVALLRRHAVWALANLGENRKQFDKLPKETRDKIVATLHEEANATGNVNRSQWAQKTLDILNGADPGVIDALAKCAKADDPDLRAMTAFALGFWSDSPDKERHKKAEDILLSLSNPDTERGQGERIVLVEND